MIRDDAGWTEVFGDAPGLVATVAEVLRDAIHTADPEAVEKAYPGYASVNFGVGPRKTTDGYGYIMAQKDRVNLGFYDGVNLPDPEGLLEGTGAALRHVKVRDTDAARSVAIAELIRAAVKRKRGGAA